MSETSFSNIVGFHDTDEEYGCFSNWYMASFLYGGMENKGGSSSHESKIL